MGRIVLVDETPRRGTIDRLHSNFIGTGSRLLVALGNRRVEFLNDSLQRRLLRAFSSLDFASRFIADLILGIPFATSSYKSAQAARPRIVILPFGAAKIKAFL